MTTNQRAPWMALSRRRLLQTGAAGAGALVLQRAMALDALAQPALDGYAYFTSSDARTMAAIANRLWPQTDTPGAEELGAVIFVDRALLRDEDLQVDFHDGLEMLNAAAQQQHGRSFANLSAEQQDQLLTSMQEGELAGDETGQGPYLFDLMHKLTMEGLFADPVYGGNRDFGGWRQVGYPGPFYIISEEQQQSFEPLDMPLQSITDL